MPRIAPELLIWARETANLSREVAVDKLGLADARGMTALQRLEALETGEATPTRPMLLKMSKLYRRPLVAFYLRTPPKRGDRGEDFRTLPSGQPIEPNAILDTLIRDVRARQSLVRAVLEDEDVPIRCDFIGTARLIDGVHAVLESLRSIVGIELQEVRKQRSADDSFALLRSRIEASGVFVLLVGDLGSHHTAIDLQSFRGFALADPIAPFVVINDHDAKTAWSFTLLHEVVHLLLGTTGVSGSVAESRIEQFCNEVAAEFLLPSEELASISVSDDVAFPDAVDRVTKFAQERLLSRTMVAYRLRRVGKIGQATWEQLRSEFQRQWLAVRESQRIRAKETEGGPNYYVVRRHRVGLALLDFARRSLNEGTLTPTKAGKVLGVKPRNVEPLLNESSPAPRGRAA